MSRKRDPTEVELLLQNYTPDEILEILNEFYPDYHFVVEPPRTTAEGTEDAPLFVG